MRKTAWQDPEVALKYLDHRRDVMDYHRDQLKLMLELVQHFRPDPRLIMDLGCGDGILATVLLGAHPQCRALLLDHSEPMLARAREEISRFGDRCEIVHADLAAPLATHAGAETIDLIVSGYAIHHLPHERKRSLYREIHDLLAPGGLFVNLEHVASPTPELEALWDLLIASRIAVHSGKPKEQVLQEHHERPDRKDNILALVETQLSWLREIGFEHVDCYYKWLELAVFGGVKRASLS
jgi:SAM-dependent methyltransferase